MKKLKMNDERLSKIEASVVHAEHCAQEAVWAHIFHDTIKNSAWLKDQSFSPGRWAVGYAYLYVLYRFLDEVHPKCILDLGLGQTTKMIAQYARHYKNVRHVVVESDPEWVSYFKRNFRVSSSTEILILPYAEREFKGELVRVYDGFSDALKDRVFDFISVDAPIGGGGTNVFNRIDIVDLIPNGVTDDVCIMMDDVDRLPDARTAEYICAKLKKSGFQVKSSVREGEKKLKIIKCQRDMFCLTV